MKVFRGILKLSSVNNPLGENQKRHRQSKCEYATVTLLHCPNEAHSMHKQYHSPGGRQDQTIGSRISTTSTLSPDGRSLYLTNYTSRVLVNPHAEAQCAKALILRSPLTRSGLHASFYAWRASLPCVVVVPSSTSWMSDLLQAA